MTQQLSVLTAVVYVLLAAALTLLSGGGVNAFLVAAISALALVVGAWCAPASYRAPLFGSPRDWSPSRRRTKALQLVVGALVTVVATVSFDATAVIWGIVAALMVGALAGERRDVPERAAGSDPE